MAECCERKKERSEVEYKDLIKRLSIIEGQVRGIKKMVENDAYCTDIMTQISAATSALNSLNRILLTNHMKSCVMDDLKEGKEETIEEIASLMAKMMK